MKPCLMSAALVALLVLAGCGGGGGSPSTSSSDAPSAPITPSTPDAVTESAQRDAQQTTSAFAEVLQSDVEFGSVTLAAGVGTLSGGARTRTSFSGNNLTVRIDAAGGSGSGILNRSQKAWTKTIRDRWPRIAGMGGERGRRPCGHNGRCRSGECRSERPF